MTEWEVSRFYNKTERSTSAFDLRLRYVCKFCGLVLPELQTRGDFSSGELEWRKRQHNQDLTDHLIRYHLKEIQESLKERKKNKYYNIIDKTTKKFHKESGELYVEWVKLVSRNGGAINHVNPSNSPHIDFEAPMAELKDKLHHMIKDEYK